MRNYKRLQIVDSTDGLDNSLDSLGHSHSLDLFGASTVVSDIDVLETSDNTIFFTTEIT